MLHLSFLLLFVGTLLICAEIFMPGFGICGISGIVLVIVACLLTVLTVPFGFFMILGELAVLVFVLAGVWKFLKQKPFRSKIILEETLNDEKSEIGDLEYFIGKEGMTTTPLRPFGKADFNGNTLEVCSRDVYIPEKRRIKVVQISHRKLIVKQIDEQEGR